MSWHSTVLIGAFTNVLINPLSPPFLGEWENRGTPPNPWQYPPEADCTSKIPLTPFTKGGNLVLEGLAAALSKD